MRKVCKEEGEEDERKLSEEKGIEDHGWLKWKQERKRRDEETGGMP